MVNFFTVFEIAMTGDEALALLNCSVKDLADMLGVKTQTVSMWKNKKVPLAREYQIRDLAAGRSPILSNIKNSQLPIKDE